jgi:hypothetical protein
MHFIKTVFSLDFILVFIEKVVPKSIIASTTIAPNSLKPNQVDAPLTHTIESFPKIPRAQHEAPWYGLVWEIST